MLLAPLHLRAPGPAPQTPLPASLFPLLRWICTDLSNTRSLDLPTTLQKFGCPGLGVQSTAPEHPSIPRTCAPSLLGPKPQAKHYESRSSPISSWNSNFPQGWTVASSPEPQPAVTPTQTLWPPPTRLPPHRERCLSLRDILTAFLLSSCCMRSGILSSTLGTCLTGSRCSIKAYSPQKLIPCISLSVRAEQGWFTIAQREKLLKSQAHETRKRVSVYTHAMLRNVVAVSP